MWLRFARRTRTSSVTEGVVVVEGKVVADRTLSIPGSTTRPVFYDIVYESFRAVPGGRGRAGWNADRTATQIVPFLLEDEAGRIWIEAESDEVEVKGGRIEIGTTGRNAAGRYNARLIMPGDVVRVRGEVFKPRKAPVERGLRAGADRPLEILLRQQGVPPADAEPDEQRPAAASAKKKGKKK
jgi:hypothetical protein